MTLWREFALSWPYILVFTAAIKHAVVAVTNRIIKLPLLKPLQGVVFYQQKSANSAKNFSITVR